MFRKRVEVHEMGDVQIYYLCTDRFQIPLKNGCCRFYANFDFNTDLNENCAFYHISISSVQKYLQISSTADDKFLDFIHYTDLYESYALSTVQFFNFECENLHICKFPPPLRTDFMHYESLGNLFYEILDPIFRHSYFIPGLSSFPSMKKEISGVGVTAKPYQPLINIPCRNPVNLFIPLVPFLHLMMTTTPPLVLKVPSKTETKP